MSAEEALQPGIGDPPWLTLARKRGKLFQKKGQSRPRDILVREKVARAGHPAAPVRIRAPNESPPLRQGKIFINPTSKPWIRESLSFTCSVDSVTSPLRQSGALQRPVGYAICSVSFIPGGGG
jgi:hypothetical protein